jgi:four helix bundle protein
MPYQDIEDSRMYQRAEQLADAVWDTVERWKLFARNTVGEQVVRAADSVGANIAESSGRFHPNDVIKFLYYARGSMRETRYWLKRAQHRRLVSAEFFNAQMAELDSLGLELNSYIKFQRTRVVKESVAEYGTNEPTIKPANHPTNKPQKVTYVTRKRKRN